MTDKNKQSDIFKKQFEFGGSELGLLVFMAPFFPCIYAKYQGVEMLVWLPLGILASCAIVDTDKKLRKVFLESKAFQKKVLMIAAVNLISIVLFHYLMALTALMGLAAYAQHSARIEYRKLMEE